ncbi:hypothetical protein ES703_06353 [subsurface metagenome]
MQKLGIILAFSLVAGGLPVWSCGMRKHLSFWEFVLEHTVLSPHPVMYIPEDLYTQPLTEEELDKLCAVSEAEQIVAGQATTYLSPP